MNMLIPLPEGALPCIDCGAICEYPTIRETIRVVPVGAPSGSTAWQELVFSLCDTCDGRRHTAKLVVEEHPRWRRRIGGKSYAEELVAAAFVLLDVTGQQGHADHLTQTDADLTELVRFAEMGVGMRWRSWFIPVRFAAAKANMYWADRYGMLGDELRKQASEAVGALLMRSLEEQTPCPPPWDGVRACMWCGLAAIESKPSMAHRAWGPRYEMRPELVGASTSHDMIYGYLCGRCRPFAPPTGEGKKIKLVDVEKALLAALDVTLPLGSEGITGVVPWAVSDAAPTMQPWSHLGPAEELRADLMPPKQRVYIDPHATV